MPDASGTPLWQTLLTLGFSSFIAALTTLVVKGIGDRDKIAAHIEWGTIDAPDSRTRSGAPFLVVQNLTLRKVYVAKVVARRGMFYFFGSQSTVMAFDDVDDLQFPYEIDPGAIHWFLLNSDAIAREANMSRCIGNWLGRLYGRSRVAVEVRTLTGAKARASDGEVAIAARDKPDWHIHPWWSRLS